MKTAKEFHNLTIEEIHNRLNELRKELMKENVHISSGTAPSNPGRLRQTKKNIARLLTIKSQKQVVFGSLETSKKSPRNQKEVQFK
ncbi:50S ribosomal protein L29 [Candidatus Woesearchaeota archaeon]|nr:50S ribosomal protein L29 [Candidatus Woesearchaeota archaeon]